MKKSRNLIVFIGVMLCTISLELALHHLNVKDEDIYLVFVLAVLITIIETKSIYYGLFGSFITIMSFNYFITEPRYTFVVNDPNNYVSFIMFIVVSFMVNSLVLQLQRQIHLSQENERKVSFLYRFSSSFLHTRNKEEVYERTVKDLGEYLGYAVSILTAEGKIYGEVINREMAEILMDSIKNSPHINVDNPMYRNMNLHILPIQSQSRSYGIIVMKKDDCSTADVEFVENVIEEMTVVLEKDYIEAEQENTKIQVANEKFKTSLLRGLSHDIRTPLTMIQSGSNFLMDSFENISDESKRELIKDIYEESVDLSEFVDNLLNMTRLDNRNVTLNRTRESVDDVLFSVYEKVKKRLGNKQLKMNYHDKLVFVDADISLLTQVLINLIENGITHTKDNTTISVDYREENKAIVFTVADNGGGIKEEKLSRIFEDFFSITSNQDKRRSHGLGLSICKAIVEAHGGTIRAWNNDKKGVSFEFDIPETEEGNG